MKLSVCKSDKYQFASELKSNRICHGCCRGVFFSSVGQYLGLPLSLTIVLPHSFRYIRMLIQYKLCIVICILSSNPAIQDSVHFWLKRVTIEYVGKLGSNPADSQNWHFGSLFFRKNLGTKKAEKSLEISAFLLFSRSVFFRTAHMAGAIGIEPTQWESEAQVLPLHQAPSHELLYITKDCFAIDFLCRNKKITAQMIFFEIIDLFLLQK